MKSSVSRERYRFHHPTLGGGHGSNGCFRIPRGKVVLGVISSSGEGWDHVSVSLPHRTPTWDEMIFIKRMFFEADEAAIMIAPPESSYVNVHPHCLHWWRPLMTSIPLPPTWMIA